MIIKETSKGSNEGNPKTYQAELETGVREGRCGGEGGKRKRKKPKSQMKPYQTELENRGQGREAPLC